METSQDKQNKAFELMKDEFGYTNVMAAPTIEKIVVSSGTGRKAKMNKDFNAHVTDRLMQITGQKPAIRAAKKSIAQFKIREGDKIGVATTLRGEKMYSFFDKLIHVALPRTRDFRGINRSVVDQMGNLTIGIKEHSIFPVASDEDLRDVFSFAITVVTTAKTKEEATKFFEILGVPFKKEAAEA